MAKEINLNPTQQQNININPKDLEDMLCSKCKCQTFEPVFLFKKLSAVLSPAGKDTIIPMQVYKCSDCSHIDEGFLPKENPSEQ